MPRQLPIELLELIAEFSSTGTLLAIACTFKALHQISIRLLYTAITLAHPTSPTRTVGCLKALAHNARFAHLVKSFSLTWFHSYDEDSLGDFYEFAPSVFERTVNLKDLSLYLDGDTDLSILSEAGFELRRLTCKANGFRTHYVAQFLETQPSIEFLSLRRRDYRKHYGLDMVALPLLHEVVAPATELQYILPQRLSHIRSIHCQSASASNIGEIVDIIGNAPTTPPSGTLINIGFDIYLTRAVGLGVESELANLGRRISWIGSLTLQAAAYGSFDRDTLLVGVTSVLRNFDNLHTFIILSERQAKMQNNVYVPIAFLPPPDQSYNTAEHKTYLDAWYLARPTLRRVQLSDSTLMPPYCCIKVIASAKSSLRHGDKSDTMSTLILSRSSPTNTKISYSDGTLAYTVDTVTKLKGRITTISRADGHELAKIDWKSLSFDEEVVSMDGEMMLMSELMPHTGQFASSDRKFKTSSGRELQWNIDGKLYCTDVETGACVATFHRSNWGVIGDKAPAYIDITESIVGDQDLIVVTCMIMENNRRYRETIKYQGGAWYFMIRPP
ncbi:hypothetical protein RhiJN_19690 [Ceratobasidium sp. AG-Ba]|nr:hypothetical protein RhiJN_19690 [Ceratobasidium sp. AG-Ba]